MAEKNVLIPVDGSENSQRAFDFYVDNLRQEKDHLFLLHIQTTPHLSTVSLDSGAAFPTEQWESKLKETIAASQKLMTHYEMLCEAKKLPKTTLMASGKPGEAICQTAKDKNAHMILMGSRGINAVRRTFLGSVSDYVLHHSHVPVTVVPPPSK